MGMNNKKRTSLLSARAGMLGGRVRASLRVYTLDDGSGPDLYFSIKLWQAAARRQEQLSRCAACAGH
jgi:hypothetical protein